MCSDVAGLGAVRVFISCWQEGDEPEEWQETKIVTLHDGNGDGIQQITREEDYLSIYNNKSYTEVTMLFTRVSANMQVNKAVSGVW